jgi:putative transposase
MQTIFRSSFTTEPAKGYPAGRLTAVHWRPRSNRPKNRIGRKIESAEESRGKRGAIMPFWQLFYHLVWSTKNRQPLLTPQVEPLIYGYLRQKAIGLEATVFALNGPADHLHMVVSIPPKIAVAKFVGQVKAVASTRYNKTPDGRQNPFFWQAEYGAFSFDRKRLPNYIGYVERQKIHHAQINTIPILERVDLADGSSLREPGRTYHIDELDWRLELEQMSG